MNKINFILWFTGALFWLTVIGIARGDAFLVGVGILGIILMFYIGLESKQ